MTANDTLSTQVTQATSLSAPHCACFYFQAFAWCHPLPQGTPSSCPMPVQSPVHPFGPQSVELSLTMAAHPADHLFTPPALTIMRGTQFSTVQTCILEWFFKMCLLNTVVSKQMINS